MQGTTQAHKKKMNLQPVPPVPPLPFPDVYCRIFLSSPAMLFGIISSIQIPVNTSYLLSFIFSH